MGNELVSSAVTVAVGIVGLAMVAVLVSKNANTSGVISSAASGFAKDLSAAVSPVTGGSGIGSFTGGSTSTF